MRTKILLTILFFCQLLTLGSAVDYSVNPINPATGADKGEKNPPATTGQCINGFAWNNQLCVPCMQVKNGYCTCTKYGGCDTKVCDKSIPNCQVLTNGSDSYILLRASGCTEYVWGDQNQSVVCKSCSPGYFMVAGICVKANNCAQMNLVTGTCDTCVDGYYFTQNYQLKTLQSWDYYQNINEVICNQCLNNCKICTSGYTCVQCNDEYYWSPTQQKTALSNQLNDSLAGQCLACSSNIPNCIRCQNSTVCDKCKDGFYYTAGSDQTQKGTCTQCMNNCLQCTNGTTCDTCNKAGGYIYLQTTDNNSCASCNANNVGCAQCSAQGGQLTCTQCLPGYVSDPNNICKLCDANCATGSCSYANDQVQCSRCKDTFIIKQNTTCNSCGVGCTSCTYDQGQTTITCQQCSDTYYLDNSNICQLCSSQITDCQKCSFNVNNTPNLTCQTCSATTQKTTDNLKCISAPQACIEYSVTDQATPATCSKCKDTYYLDTNTCKSCATSNPGFLRCQFNNNQVTPIQCQDQYFLLNNNCVPVKNDNTQATNLTLQTCLTITDPTNDQKSYQCQTCLPAALGDSPPQTGVCSYCNCNNDAKNTANCTAAVASQKSTVTCTASNLTCLPGFLKSGQSCLPCSPVAVNPIDTQKYQLCCGLGLIYSSGPDQCTAQTVTGAAQCIASYSDNPCMCDVGYYKTGTTAADYQCNKCADNCDKCTSTNTCDTCSVNYTKITISSNESQCVQIKCLAMNSTTGCTYCQYGFYLQKINGVNYCLQCLSPLTNSICRQYLNTAPTVTVTPTPAVVIQNSPSYLCSNGNYWNGQYCSPCKSLQSGNGYCVCSTYMDCPSIVCNSGYALVKGACVPIPDGCTTYQISNDGTTLICTACKDSYSLVSNVCLKTQNCQQFSSTTGNCIQCANGYYLNWQYNTFVSQGVQQGDTIPYFFNFPSQCTQCDISNCLTCTGPKVCATCAQGYYWQTSQYLQQSSNGSQGSCQPCMQGCQTCTNNQSCSTCYPGYYMVFPYSGINYCQLCSTPISNCLTCDNSTTPPHAQSLVPTCRSCSSGYYLYNGKCVICPAGCLACDGDNSCTQCASQGYAYDSTNKKCSLCSQITGCTQCSYNGTTLTCSTCADLYYRSVNNNITTCALCSVPVNQQAATNYLRCTSATSPTQCKEGYYLNGSSCTLINLTLHCLTFDNNGNCTSCVNGYIIVGNSCQQCISTNAQCIKCQVISGTGTTANLQCAACQYGYYLTSTYGCTACVKADGCEACNSSGCASCLSGYYPTTVSTDSNNSTGSSVSNNTVNCNKCVSNCQVCQQANSCTKCNDGYFLITTTSSGTTSVTTSSCYACQPECQTCVAPGTTCTSCITGYVFQNGGCVTLAQANCFSNGSNGCEVCNYGYYLNNGVCYQCVNPQSDFLCTNPVDNLFTSVTPTTL